MKSSTLDSSSRCLAVLKVYCGWLGDVNTSDDLEIDALIPTSS